MWHFVNSSPWRGRPLHYRVTALGKLLTHVYLCHQAVEFDTGHRAVMLCGWEANHWPDWKEGQPTAGIISHLRRDRMLVYSVWVTTFTFGGISRTVSAVSCVKCCMLKICLYDTWETDDVCQFLQSFRVSLTARCCVYWQHVVHWYDEQLM